MKTAGIADQPFCVPKFYLYLTPPENSLSIENLKTHIRVKFDTAIIPVAYRKITRVGVQNSMDSLATPTHKRYLEVNASADGSGIVDLFLDLSSLIKKDNVEFWPGGGASYPDATNYLYLEVPVETYGYLAPPTYWKIGDVQLWKADGLFTIKEIR